MKKKLKYQKLTDLRLSVPVIFFVLALLLSTESLAKKASKPPPPQRFNFPVIVEVRPPPESPPKWPSKEAEPARLLTLGRPHPISRPPLQFLPAVFLPLELGLLQGSSRLIQLYNRAVTSWGRGALEETERLLGEGVPLAKALPRSHLDRRSFYLLRGHFMFRKWLSQLDAPEDKQLPLRAMYGFSYFEAYGLQDNSSLLESSTDTDGLVLRRSLQTGFVPNMKLLLDEAKGKVGGAFPPLVVQEKIIDPSSQLKSHSFAVMWNAITLQGAQGDWQKAFELADAADLYFKKMGPNGPHFEGVEGHALLRIYDVNTVENQLSLLPKRRTDFAAAVHLMRANAFFVGRDLMGILEHAQKAYRIAEDPQLKALSLQIVGNIYFDIAYYEAASRAFEWAFKASPSFAEISPALSFFRAEAMFWQGRFSEAKTLHQDFLSLIGDKKYGPYSKLRIALVDHLQGKISNAAAQYELIQRLHPTHLVASDARVRLFCLSNLKETRKFQILSLESILKEVESTRDDLREQAKACAVKNQMAVVSEPWKDEKAREMLALSAKKSIEPIQQFSEEYPKSPYLKLYETERQQLAWMEGKQILESEVCRDIIDFYSKNGDVLFSTKAGNARWTSEEKKRLIRCSYEASEEKLFLKGIAATWEPAHVRTQKIIHKLMSKPNKRNYEELRLELGKRTDLAALAEEHESLGREALTDPRYWVLLAAHKLYTWDFSQGKVQSVSQKSDDCLGDLERSESKNRKTLDGIFLSRKPEEWIKSLTEAGDSSETRCQSALAERLLSHARKGVSQTLVDGLWRPWLDSLKFSENVSSWLEFAQWQELQTPDGKKKAKTLYEKIQKDAPEGLEKEAAKLWLQQNP